ncbi:DNA methyltransferase [Devosia sp.]|uniref:class I SAM-dependent DNA methyltransferase n=1 Tax=Devosia sp. TaxID=1871048 RepID=UPI001B1E7E04|nr:DNA methyltransferase [Devosia sp.]MBO9590614.1 class I SAM-dependent DNA methyltransferase [Devosia sp.]
MNPTEIADALEAIAKQPFDPAEFGFAFAHATDSAKATVAKLRGATNKSDLPGGVLLSKRFHYAPAARGAVEETLASLRASKKTASGKPAILIATDGDTVSAEHPKSGDTLHCAFAELGRHFSFLLPAAGKDRYQAAEENPVDVTAAGKLAKLYDALMRGNPDWSTPARRHDMNLFMTRMIFCLFSEDVGIFAESQFSRAVFSYSGNKGEHARETIVQAFTAMNLPKEQRAGLPEWARQFEYVNGGLFADGIDAPNFDPLAFRYLRDACDLNWKLINPDIFGSMIQSIADPGARSELGMHYTSVPNIMKVLGPLFLDDLDTAIEKAWDKPTALRAQLSRLARIRVFDPACGSGNFLVVAYRELRDREIRLLKRLADLEANPLMQMFSSVALGNFHGIEITDFAAETAKLALFIADYQANTRFADVFGQMPPMLPLRDGGHIITDNALRVDWDTVCPPPAENEEVYIAGNPPFLGATYQTKKQKDDMAHVFGAHVKSFAAFDYVAAWFFKASQYIRGRRARVALVSTNSICQGYSVPALWPHILRDDLEIDFAHREFRWSNNASANAAVVCSIVGVRNKSDGLKRLYDRDLESRVQNINAYLVSGHDIFVEPVRRGLFDLPFMDYGNKPADGGHLILTQGEHDDLVSNYPASADFMKRYMGAQEVTKGLVRYCIWVPRGEAHVAGQIPGLAKRFEQVRQFRLASTKEPTRRMADHPYEFDQIRIEPEHDLILVPIHSSERREVLPCERAPKLTVPSNANNAIINGGDWCISVICSRLHLVWIASVCGKIKSDFRYSNTLGWNTFPVPKFTADQLDQLSASARRILKTRYQHYPKTIADLYEPDKMPDDLRAVHQENDDLLETMYIGRPFRNDTERLERLFKLYAAKVAPKRNK